MDPVVRNLHFTIDDSVPRFWHGGRRSITIFLDNLSIFFPAGERFFVRSVRAHQPLVRDPALEREVRAFCGQEGVHAREHEFYNGLLKRHGYPIEDMEKRVEAILSRVIERTTDDLQLAVTCALEHFTALLGGYLLDDPRLLEGAHPVMAALWRWHAAEENEHKNVAYDVYRAAGGDYATRAYAMVGATVIFWAKVLEHQARMMKAADILYSPDEWVALVRFLFVKPGGMQRLIPLYLQYFRPGFHPSQIDSETRLEAWRADFATSPTYARGASAVRAPRSEPALAE
jgi:predicted metal-dependent hydrolase